MRAAGVTRRLSTKLASAGERADSPRENVVSTCALRDPVRLGARVRRRVVPEHGLGRLRRRGGGDEGPQGERGAPRSKGAAPGTSSRILGRVNGGALGTRPAARPPSTTRPPAKPARPVDSDPVANEEGVLTLDLLREAAGAAGAGPSDAVELDLHNRGITTLARGALGRCGATLADLDLSFNAVSVVEGLEPLVALRHLRVYDNRVTDLRGLRAVGATLRSLRAQNNAFASLEGVETLRALTLLRVDGNPLGTHQGTRLVGRCTALTRLDISRCGLTKLEGFATLHRLSTLAAAGNRLRSLEPLAKCVSLTELDVADNRLSDDALRHLAPLRRLDALVLDGNPIRDPSKMPTLPELVELSLASAASRRSAREARSPPPHRPWKPWTRPKTPCVTSRRTWGRRWRGTNACRRFDWRGTRAPATRSHVATARRNLPTRRRFGIAARWSPRFLPCCTSMISPWVTRNAS